MLFMVIEHYRNRDAVAIYRGTRGGSCPRG
jgi:hypothetical protein